MNRRSFFAALAGAVVAPRVVQAVAEPVAPALPLDINQWCQVEFEWDEYEVAEATSLNRYLTPSDITREVLSIFANNLAVARETNAEFAADFGAVEIKRPLRLAA